MCGRFTITVPREKIERKFCIKRSLLPDYGPRFNVAPGQEIPIVLEEALTKERILEASRWGFMPHWAKEDFSIKPQINARSESLAERPAFRDAFRKNRCLVIADGFYEWKKEERRKQPFYIRLKSHELFAFAGLWSDWKSPAGNIIRTSTIITTPANRLLYPVHDRMPVILSEETIDEWLDPDREASTRLLSFLKPYPDEELECFPIERVGD